MTDERFDRFWPELMKYEGGATLVNDPDDTGGMTRYGISKRAYPKVNIQTLTEERAKEIFFNDYYLPLKIPAIADEKLAWQIFDFGVNAGVFRSAKTIQRILSVIPDGSIGNKTLNKIELYDGESPLWIVFTAERVKYYLTIAERRPANRKFLKGWILRATRL